MKSSIPLIALAALIACAVLTGCESEQPTEDPPTDVEEVTEPEVKDHAEPDVDQTKPDEEAAKDGENDPAPEEKPEEK